MDMVRHHRRASRPDASSLAGRRHNTDHHNLPRSLLDTADRHPDGHTNIDDHQHPDGHTDGDQHPDGQLHRFGHRHAIVHGNPFADGIPFIYRNRNRHTLIDTNLLSFSDSNRDRYSVAYVDTDGNSFTAANCHQHTFSIADRHTNINTVTHEFTNPIGHTDPLSFPDRNAGTDKHRNRDPVPYRNRDGEPIGNPHLHPHGYRQQHPNTDCSDQHRHTDFFQHANRHLFADGDAIIDPAAFSGHRLRLCAW